VPYSCAVCAAILLHKAIMSDLFTFVFSNLRLRIVAMAMNQHYTAGMIVASWHRFYDTDN